jgi:spermidine synthase
MKPTERLDTATFPDGSKMTLLRHDGDFSITLNGQILMTSRQTESELELARLGCRRLTRRKDPTVLIGGLGLGYTLRQTLDLLGKQAKVIVAELRPEVVRWNREHLGEITGHPLRDRRVVVRQADVFDLIRSAKHAYDAILLDLDNGPDAKAPDRNDGLYSRFGLQSCINALLEGECLGVWSAEGDARFERRMRNEHLYFRRFSVRAHKGGRARCRTVWIASTNARNLPPESRPNAEHGA